ncbi:MULTISPECIES: VRR-NUC domain-containing protein [unclassified Chelatococcus]|uniref:VRR-NUC domain-containing protein n=1 Tax=unclassified Chelatococcus TaxID=2638111 RepID=UPI001BD12F93|nr:MULTISPECIES: VRR-NUC domain-containing protein [unclassified Chelatococcus]MBS7737924.1 VRR-NUC domain-containing protein [Chelatococcus sp. HY11]MCO5077107.1 VRR-NUC domain-containing protein [Chelatococcus sp.]
MQHAAVRALFQAKKSGQPLRYAGSMSAGKRSPRDRAIAKATGLEPGEPDLSIYLPGGRLLQIEIKTTDGELSSEQIDAHAEILELGFPPVAVVIAKDEDDAASQTMALVRQRIQDSQ